MKLVYQYMAILYHFYFKTTSHHLHPLQVENCSNSRHVEDEDDNGEVSLEWVKYFTLSVRG